MAFAKFKEAIVASVNKLLGKPVIDAKAVKEFVRDLQRALLKADVNVKLVLDLTRRIEDRILKEELPPGFTRRDIVLKVVYEELVNLLGGEAAKEPQLEKGKTNVIMLVGIQGSGKTTTAAKLAAYWKKKGYKVALVCADTYRPGAYEQLQQLAQQAGIPVYGNGTKRSAVEIALDGLKKFRQEGYDVVIIDTAGRHKNEKALMEEMKELAEKIRPDKVVMVLDAHIGQQAYTHALEFHRVAPLGSIIVTKLDGTAKGGGALSAVAATGARIEFIGTGEKLDDLEVFNPPSFVSRLLGMGDLQALVEKIREAQLVSEEAIRNIMSGKFTLYDLEVQLRSIKRMGPLSKVLSLVPGLGTLSEEHYEVTEEKIGRWLVILQSMTEEEKRKPSIIDGSRVSRIARGSGTSPRDVRELLKYYETMKKLLKSVSRKRAFLKPSLFGRKRLF